jgi:hypothetical protein
MKKIFSLVLISLFTISLYAQKTVNDANAEVRKVGSFTSLSVSNAFDVIITQGAEEGLAVSASDKEDIQYIKTEVSGNTLKIWFDSPKKIWVKNRKLRAYVSVKKLEELKASGASDINVEGSLSAADFKLSLSGASDFDGKINASGSMEIHSSGASDIEITGSANEISIDASGASNVKAIGFTANSCKKIEGSGASSISISVTNDIAEAKLSGASSLVYKGNPSVKNIKTSGASSISRKS